MNKDRRAELAKLAEDIANVLSDINAAKDTLDDLREQLEGIKDGEQEYLDNMPEAFQQGDRGQTAEAAISEMEEAIGKLEEAAEHLGERTGVICLDYETAPIIDGSGLAPFPVGVAINGYYYGWGHPGKNPHSFEAGRRAVAEVWDQPLVFHNAKFDIGVAMEHMGLPWPHEFDDTMIQAYLVDPLAKGLGLKPLAERWLRMPAEEKDAVFRWLKANFKGPFLPDHKMITPTNAGAYISYAPYDVVAPYAVGDTLRTKGLHSFFRKRVTSMGMEDAYARELTLVRHGYEMEKVGVRVNRPALQRDHEKYQQKIVDCEHSIRSYLGDIELTPANLARGLVEGGYADSLPLTPTGKLSTAKAAIEANVQDKVLGRAIRYRGALQTTSNFFKQWLAFSERDGNVHPSWNQTKNDKGFGARTGRFSCNGPNLTNVPTEYEEEVLQGLDMPYMRQYILPDDGHVLVPADYNGQEMRGLAHYSGGRMAEVYRTDPHADFHEVASALIKQYSGLTVPRKMCKITGFSLIYGSGIDMLARQLGVEVEVARQIKAAYFKAFPGLPEFMRIFRDRDAIRTWGGRRLPCEQAHEVDGVWREFNYKLLNYLIQGSAADQTKEAVIRYGNTRKHGRLLMTVHDELVMSVPMGYIKTEATLLRRAMEDMPGWDIPFRVEMEYGKNWFDLKALQ